MTNDKDSAVLLPCPTEGCESGKIEVGYLFGVYYVECDACGGQGDLAWNERNAVENWNHRPALRQPTQSDALREAVIEECAKALEADAMKCDCAALEERECGCGAWCEWKSITSARAVEIVRSLQKLS